MKKLLELLSRPYRKYQEAKEERDCAQAEFNALMTMLETGEPQTMPERFIERQKALGRPVSFRPGPNYHKVFGSKGKD